MRLYFGSTLLVNDSTNSNDAYLITPFSALDIGHFLDVSFNLRCFTLRSQAPGVAYS